MKRWMRKVRGAIGMGLTWATAWFTAGMVLLLIVGPDAADVPFPLFFGLLGFLAGVTFSAILGIAERRRRFDQMSIPRFATWGAVGGLLFAAAFASAASLGLGTLAVLAPVFAASGAACAGGTLALARRAADRQVLSASSELESVGLTEEEKRQLLGGKG